MKFKVGDRVVSNKQADEVYNVTRDRWHGKVVEVRSEKCIVVVSTTGRDTYRYPVDPAYFDLVAPTQKILVTSDGRETLARLYRDEKLVKML